nr:MAG TPA: hypothetical protein [Caudoviricetes sp.]
MLLTYGLILKINGNLLYLCIDRNNSWSLLLTI